MNVAFCDDMSQERDVYVAEMKRLAKKHDIALDLSMFDSGDSLLFSFDDFRDPPDAVFMDICMPGRSGVEVAQLLRARGYHGIIVFVSSSNDYFIPAFDAEAFNYVIKEDDISKSRFAVVFEKVIEHAELNRRKYLLLHNMKEHLNLPIDTIRYFEVVKHIVKVHYDNDDKTFDFVSSLGKIETMLLSYGFVKIHRSFLVNCAYVENYTSKTAIMRDGTELPVGRACVSDFTDMMKARATVTTTTASTKA